MAAPRAGGYEFVRCAVVVMCRCLPTISVFFVLSDAARKPICADIMQNSKRATKPVTKATQTLNQLTIASVDASQEKNYNRTRFDEDNRPARDGENSSCSAAVHGVLREPSDNNDYQEDAYSQEEEQGCLGTLLGDCFDRRLYVTAETPTSQYRLGEPTHCASVGVTNISDVEILIERPSRLGSSSELVTPPDADSSPRVVSSPEVISSLKGILTPQQDIPSTKVVSSPEAILSVKVSSPKFVSFPDDVPYPEVVPSPKVMPSPAALPCPEIYQSNENPSDEALPTFEPECTPRKRRKIMADLNVTTSNQAATRRQVNRMTDKKTGPSDPEMHELDLKSSKGTKALARVALESGLDRRRPYTLSSEFKNLTNIVGLKLFSMFSKEKNVCLSPYGLSFLVAVLDPASTKTEGALKEVLRYGGLASRTKTPLAQSCIEVVSTLRRRVCATDDVNVKTGVYLRNSGPAAAGRTFSKNITRHVFSAEFKIAFQGCSRGAWCDVLFNTARFANSWSCPFSKQSTYSGTFFNNWTDKVPVQMMRRTAVFPYASIGASNTDIVVLPFDDCALSMVVFSQRTPSNPFLLTPETLSTLCHSLRDALVTVHLPKFELSSSLDLTTRMNEVFSQCNETSRVEFTDVHQSSCIVVSEGEEPRLSVDHSFRHSDKSVTVMFDRPFSIVVCERDSGLVLYLGKVASLNATVT